MSVHAYSRCWLHLVWATLNREPILSKEAAVRISSHFQEYADSKGVYLKINYVSAGRVHLLIDLPTRYSMEELMQLLKGESSHWINGNKLVNGRFA